MFGDVVLTWRPQNIASIVAMWLVASFVLVAGVQLFKKLGAGSNG